MSSLSPASLPFPDCLEDSSSIGKLQRAFSVARINCSHNVRHCRHLHCSLESVSLFIASWQPNKKRKEREKCCLLCSGFGGERNKSHACPSIDCFCLIPASLDVPSTQLCILATSATHRSRPPLPHTIFHITRTIHPTLIITSKDSPFRILQQEGISGVLGVAKSIRPPHPLIPPRLKKAAVHPSRSDAATTT